MHREPMLENEVALNHICLPLVPLGSSKLVATEPNYPKTLLLRHLSDIGVGRLKVTVELGTQDSPSD